MGRNISIVPAVPMSGFWHNYRSSMAGQEQSLSNSFCQGTNSTPVPWNRHSTRAMSEDEELSNLSYQKTQMVPLTSISVLINRCSTRVVGQEEELNSVSPPEETNGPIGIDISTFRQTQHACNKPRRTKFALPRDAHRPMDIENITFQ